MQDIRLGPVEAQFAGIVWDNAPLTTAQLVTICAKELNWKRTTTYTVLKKLSEKGLFLTQKGLVTVAISREEYESLQSTQFVRESFSGSLPAFLAAFTRKQPLTAQEAAQLRRLLQEFEEEEK